ncbi:hypothetical protein [Polyangium sp. y55x31]|uniref:hypothetical protein n=1 Tax=Polyangium sp. y55x31 TaxID=3042688 RepID=UPI00248215A2|nr:hypothetical protein [Polyangium sp. y55x31]MDI1476431.1 hypothetical protein [Polyangium sp. y55x31]
MNRWHIALLLMFGMLTTGVGVHGITTTRQLTSAPPEIPPARDEPAARDELLVVDVLASEAPRPLAAEVAPVAPPRKPLPASSRIAATQPPPSPQPAPSAPPPEEVGTLVAVAVGGPCEFSVDDVSITSSTTLRLPLPPGVHVVKCGPRTRTVTVKNGEIAMALFKL